MLKYNLRIDYETTIYTFFWCNIDTFFPHPTQFEIINELGEIIFHVEYILGQTYNRYGSFGFIQSIHIVDKYRREVVKGDIYNEAWNKVS